MDLTSSPAAGGPPKDRLGGSDLPVLYCSPMNEDSSSSSGSWREKWLEFLPEGEG